MSQLATPSGQSRFSKPVCQPNPDSQNLEVYKATVGNLTQSVNCCLSPCLLVGHIESAPVRYLTNDVCPMEATMSAIADIARDSTDPSISLQRHTQESTFGQDSAIDSGQHQAPWPNRQFVARPLGRTHCHAGHRVSHC